MQSTTLPIYEKFLNRATLQEIEFVDRVYAMCEANYDRGGDTICECVTPSEILLKFKTMDEARAFCGLKVEQELNARWGEDSDPELKRASANKNWK